MKNKPLMLIIWLPILIMVVALACSAPVGRQSGVLPTIDLQLPTVFPTGTSTPVVEPATATPEPSPTPIVHKLSSHVWEGKSPAPDFVKTLEHWWGEPITKDSDIGVVIYPGSEAPGGFGTYLVPEYYANAAAILGHNTVNYDEAHRYLTPFSHSVNVILGTKCQVYGYAKEPEHAFNTFPYAGEKFVRIFGTGTGIAIEGFNWKENGAFFAPDTKGGTPLIYILTKERFSFENLGKTLGCE